MNRQAAVAVDEALVFEALQEALNCTMLRLARVRLV